MKRPNNPPRMIITVLDYCLTRRQVLQEELKERFDLTRSRIHGMKKRLLQLKLIEAEPVKSTFIWTVKRKNYLRWSEPYRGKLEDDNLPGDYQLSKRQKTLRHKA